GPPQLGVGPQGLGPRRRVQPQGRRSQRPDRGDPRRDRGAAPPADADPMSPLPAPEPRPERLAGPDGRDCGEHRTTGPRAWCPTCQEWCYPGILCRGCELPLLRARAEQAEAALQRVREAIEIERAGALESEAMDGPKPV